MKKQNTTGNNKDIKDDDVKENSIANQKNDERKKK
jgi:hypothetical protein